MMFQLLPQMMYWLNAKDRQQQKFRTAVITKLCRIEACIASLYPPILAREMKYDPDKLMAELNTIDESVSKQQHDSVMAVLKYIYAVEPKTEEWHDRRKKWHGWEI